MRRHVHAGGRAGVAVVLCAAALAVLYLFSGVPSASSSPPPVMRLDPTAIKLNAAADGNFTLDIVADGASDLGAFEFRLVFDTDFMKLTDIEVGPFLGSTGRVVSCQDWEIIGDGIAAFSCNTTGPVPDGPDGFGVLATASFMLQPGAGGETLVELSLCEFANVLGAATPINGCKDTKVDINPATATPPDTPSFEKVPALQNLFLTQQGSKIPPQTCLAGSDVAIYREQLSQPIRELPDPKDPLLLQQLGAFEFEVHYDDTKVCIELQPGAAADGMFCVIKDARTSPSLEGIARIGCVSSDKSVYPDTNTVDGRHLADIIVRPQPDVYSQVRPNQDNGVVIQLNDVACELADLQGHPLTVFSCDDADLTIRFLEGDIRPDCVVNALDTQAIAFRWGVEKGSLTYTEFMNLEPSGTQADNDIDIKDLQFVHGRFGSDCEDPHPPQQPVNPKEGGGPTPTNTPTEVPPQTPTPPGTPQPDLNKSPIEQTLLLSAPPLSGECDDSADFVTFDLILKDPITTEDPKEPGELQLLGGFSFIVQFDEELVCVEVDPGDIPLGEMTCLTLDGPGSVTFGCLTPSKETPPDPQPPGVLATVTVRAHPDVYAMLNPNGSDQLMVQITNTDCELADLQGHAIKSGDCDDATVTIRYP